MNEEHLTSAVSLAEDNLDRANRKIAKTQDHLAQAKQAKAEAVASLKAAKAELARWAKTASAGDAVSGAAHDASVTTESNN